MHSDDFVKLMSGSFQEEAERYRQERDPSDESSELRLAEEELIQVRESAAFLWYYYEKIGAPY